MFVIKLTCLINQEDILSLTGDTGVPLSLLEHRGIKLQKTGLPTPS